MILWTKFLSEEGRSIAKKAEKAQDTGNYALARQLYLKTAAKYREASEVCEDFNELNVLRSLASYYYNRALKLENLCGFSNVVLDEQVSSRSIKKGTHSFDVNELLKGTDIQGSVLEAVIQIAIEISYEGREGHPIGTAFIIGDTSKVMACSRQLILNPFEGHSREKRMITDPETHDDIKEFAQLDGVFIVSSDGVVEAAGRYITIDTGIIKMQRGLGTRHSSVAAITLVTSAIGVVISQSGGVIRIFKDGKIAGIVRPYI